MHRAALEPPTSPDAEADRLLPSAKGDAHRFCFCFCFGEPEEAAAESSLPCSSDFEAAEFAAPPGGAVISIAQIPAGRMYMEARKFPVTS